MKLSLVAAEVKLMSEGTPSGIQPVIQPVFLLRKNYLADSNNYFFSLSLQSVMNHLWWFEQNILIKGVFWTLWFWRVETSQTSKWLSKTKQWERPMWWLYIPVYIIWRGVFSVARYDNQGNAKASTRGTSDRTGSTSFFLEFMVEGADRFVLLKRYACGGIVSSTLLCL